MRQYLLQAYIFVAVAVGTVAITHRLLEWSQASVWAALGG